MGDTSNGVSAMVRLAYWSERRLGCDVATIGRSGLDRRDTCTLQTSGRHLFYTLVLDGGFLFFYAQPMDTGDPFEHLVTVGDTQDGWNVVARLLQALEHSGITSLQPRPIQLGEVGDPNCFVIG
jgi:hypothetical protein